LIRQPAFPPRGVGSKANDVVSLTHRRKSMLNVVLIVILVAAVVVLIAVRVKRGREKQ
jgi:hypothetical protein